ncbi:hypothetical protein JYU34_019289 [Plutella xylostella]|uniref:Uncharacterized protein n=1 Tax=Plutella xylostella TaxID=51655 RepID=A0ABQ7PWP8_PLUXY|nr:hypothetical protein JYU34_019289 [Plutella xylostella]
MSLLLCCILLVSLWPFIHSSQGFHYEGSLNCVLKQDTKDLTCKPGANDFILTPNCMWTLIYNFHANIYKTSYLTTTAISLKSCRIIRVMKDGFMYLSAIRHLDLSNNKMSSLECGSLDGLKSLSYLNLAQNSLTSICNDVFHGVPLIVLDLGSNQLQTLSAQYPVTLNIIDISHNNINCLNVFYTQLVSQGVRLDFIFFDNNPWKCSCLFQILRTLKSHNVSYSSVTFNGKNEVCDM